MQKLKKKKKLNTKKTGSNSRPLMSLTQITNLLKLLGKEYREEPVVVNPKLKKQIMDTVLALSTKKPTLG